MMVPSLLRDALLDYRSRLERERELERREREFSREVTRDGIEVRA